MRLLLLLLAPVVTAAFVLSRRQQRDPPPSPWQGPTWRERFAERLKDPRTQGFLTGAGLVGAGFAADRLRVTMAERKRYGSKDTKAPFRRQETELTSAQSDQLWKMQQYERHIRGGVEEYEYQQCLESEGLTLDSNMHIQHQLVIFVKCKEFVDGIYAEFQDDKADDWSSRNEEAVQRAEKEWHETAKRWHESEDTGKTIIEPDRRHEDGDRRHDDGDRRHDDRSGQSNEISTIRATASPSSDRRKFAGLRNLVSTMGRYMWPNSKDVGTASALPKGLGPLGAKPGFAFRR